MAPGSKEERVSVETNSLCYSLWVSRGRVVRGQAHTPERVDWGCSLRQWRGIFSIKLSSSKIHHSLHV